MPASSSQGHNNSLQRLTHVEKMIVKVLELAGSAMDELAAPAGPRRDAIAGQCHEFMQSIKEIQSNMREEIKSACEYRPFEMSDYSSRIANEIAVEKLEYVIGQLEGIKLNLDGLKDSS